MKKSKKILLLLLFLGAVAGGAVYYMAMKEAPTAADSKPLKSFKADELIAEFEKNHLLADSLYKEKNIAVEGKLKQINEGAIILEGGPSADISCTFDSVSFAQNKTNFTEGSVVKIKGIYFSCDGFAASASEDDMFADLGKIIKLKTCAINK
jgi:hypothetical protein